MTLRTRSFPLEDIAVSKTSDGRTVEAFAAVFHTRAEVHDQDGDYHEELAPTAFDKTVGEGRRADGTWRFGVFYNHGLTIHGTPSERGSIPLGTPMHIEATKRGLLTVTRYNTTPLADDVLDAIRNGDITGQSFTGRFLQSEGHRRGQRLARRKDGTLPVVRRTEVQLVEYGPTPMPVYADAEIVGVRAALQHLSDDQLAALLAGTPSLGAAPEQPLPGALRSAVQWAHLRAQIRERI